MNKNTLILTERNAIVAFLSVLLHYLPIDYNKLIFKHKNILNQKISVFFSSS